jgi:hypothetical protein
MFQNPKIFGATKDEIKNGVLIKADVMVMNA